MLGSSTLMVICVSPMAILHIFITLYVRELSAAVFGAFADLFASHLQIEYFGLPIGLWRISTKLTHTFTELIFICLFSSILSLSMDDLFTSALECTAYTPYARYNDPPPVVGNSSVDGTLAKSMCNQQIAIVVVVFLSVILYVSARSVGRAFSAAADAVLLLYAGCNLDRIALPHLCKSHPKVSRRSSRLSLARAETSRLVCRS